MFVVSVMSVLMSLLLGLLIFLASDFYRLPKSRFFKFRDLVMTYLMRRIMFFVVRYQWWSFQRDVRNVVSAQERFLLRQIRNNEDTAYGRDHWFQRIHSLADFRRMHPVTDYYHYSDYIARAEKGETTAILGKSTIQLFACSSGTTGKPKHIPVSDDYIKIVKDILGVMHGFFPNRVRWDLPLYKDFQIMCLPRWRYADCGVPIGPISGLGMKSGFMMRQWSMPAEANVIESETEAIYVSLLFALRDRDLGFMEGGFASGCYNFLSFLEHNWQDLVEDIKSGKIKESLNISADKRRIINSCLISDPARALELEMELQKGMESIVRRIFPKLSGINVLSSGTSMSLYKGCCLPFLKGVEIQALLYGSSEALIGVNMRAKESEEQAFVVIPSVALIEFLPVDETGSAIAGAKPLLATEVELGKLYEPIVTNCSGFYRYRMGDVVKVVDFYHQAPAVDFQFRTSQLLNVHMEKLSEQSFYQALQATVRQWPGVTLRDFTTAESVLDPSPRPGPPYYLVFLELETGEVSVRQLDMLDTELCRQHYVYNSFRVKDAIGPMKVLLVEAGGFAAFRQFTLDTSATYLGQFKQARVLRSGGQVECFMKHVLSTQNAE